MRAGAISSTNDLLVEIERLLLMPQQRMIEADRVADLEAIGRIDRDALVAVLHLDRPQDLDRLARRAEFLHAGVLNQVDPRRRAAVHDRHFGVIELDDDVVDAEAAQRRQQMLDRLDRRFVGDEAGLELLAAAEVRDVSGNFDAAEVGALEANSVISRSRLERERHLLAGVKSDPGAGNGSAKGTLSRPCIRYSRPPVSKPAAKLDAPADIVS